MPGAPGDNGDHVERIVKAVERAIMGELSEYVVPPSRVWVTEVSGCIRQSFYNRIYAREVDWRAAYSILRGRLFHELILSKIPLGEPETVGEKKRSIEIGEGGHEVRLEGRVDLYTEDYVVDLKTSEREPRSLPEEYVNQLTLYMLLYGKRRALIVYLTPRGLKSFEIGWDEERAARLLDKARRLSQALRRNKPPPPETGYWCRFCPWASEKTCPEGLEHVRAMQRAREAEE